MGIVVQQLFVNWHQDQDTGEQGFVYQASPPPWPGPTGSHGRVGDADTKPSALWKSDESVPELRFQRVANWDRLRDHDVATLYIQAKQLVDRAAQGRKRDGDQLDQKAFELGLKVIPRCGLLNILTRGAHPQMSTTNDFVAHIPWEAIQERYMICPKGCTTIRVVEADTSYCSRCRSPMEFVVSRLSVSYHLSHLVHGQRPVLSKGKEFLFIEDPLEDLCSRTNDPRGLCEEHLETIRRRVRSKGFSILQLSGEAATGQQVRKYLGRGNVVGIYYFGHGLYDRSKNEGCLRLNDGLIFASEVAEINPTVSFVFLNGCYSALPGSDWVVERRPRSVAEAFGRRARAVVAPIFPVLNTDAALFAKTVFARILGDAPIGEAVTAARRESLDRFEEEAQPDICWMAYRLLGNPNSTLPIPREIFAVGQDVEKQPSRRVFDDNGQLKMEFFGFEAEEVFARAGRRRVWQDRTLVTTGDMLAGLLRKGELTRTLVHQSHNDPDRVYERLFRAKEDDPPGTAQKAGPYPEIPKDNGGKMTLEAFLRRHEEQLRRLVERGAVRSRDECTEELAEVLKRADESAQLDVGDADALITERSILESVLDSGNWPSRDVKGLPSAGEVKGYLRDVMQTGLLDDNGLVHMEHLSKDARKIIDTAHSLSQQRGVRVIPNRLVLAAFFADEESYAARLLEDYGQDPMVHFGMLVSSVSKHHSLTFGLGWMACSRAIAPVLEYCTKAFGPNHKVEERDLFKSFCEVVPEALKESLRDGPYPIDLDFLKQLEPLPPIITRENFDETGWTVVCLANEYASHEGSSKIRTGHLLAAMAKGSGDQAHKYLRSCGLDTSQVFRMLTNASADAGEIAQSRPGLRPSFNARSILVRAVRLAKEVRGHSAATVEEIFYASLTDWDMLVSRVRGIRRCR